MDVLGSAAGRTTNVDPYAVKVEKDGSIKGRAADGSPIKGRIVGKSLARQLMEKEEERKRQERARQKRALKRKRRRKRGT